MSKDANLLRLLAWQQEAKTDGADGRCYPSGGKRIYTTLEEAERERDKRDRGGRIRGSVYRCPFCGHFHMTRQRPPNGDKSKFLRPTPARRSERAGQATPRR